jgi:hypothetical protein
MIGRILIVWLALVICSGCDIEYEPIEVVESTQRPYFILDVRTQVNDTPHPPLIAYNTVCFWLNVPALLRVGDRANEVNDHLFSHSVLIVDDAARTTVIMSNSPAVLKFKYDENNNLIGTYSDLNLCYGIDNLAVGIHPANFVTESTDGEAYSYSFELKVK